MGLGHSRMLDPGGRESEAEAVRVDQEEVRRQRSRSSPLEPLHGANRRKPRDGGPARRFTSFTIRPDRKCAAQGSQPEGEAFRPPFAEASTPRKPRHYASLAPAPRKPTAARYPLLEGHCGGPIRGSAGAAGSKKVLVESFTGSASASARTSGGEGRRIGYVTRVPPKGMRKWPEGWGLRCPTTSPPCLGPSPAPSPTIGGGLRSRADRIPLLQQPLCPPGGAVRRRTPRSGQAPPLACPQREDDGPTPEGYYSNT